MEIYKYADEILTLIILTAGLMLGRPILSWLLMKLYNLFIGSNHI